MQMAESSSKCHNNKNNQVNVDQNNQISDSNLANQTYQQADQLLSIKYISPVSSNVDVPIRFNVSVNVDNLTKPSLLTKGRNSQPNP